MEYSISTEKNWKTTVSVTVTAQDVKAQYDNAVKKIQKDAKLEGFRKGKVPVQLVKKLYGDLIDSEAEDMCIEQAWRTVFEENDFHVINDPSISNLNKTDDGGMTFEINFDVLPEFTVDGFEGMEVEKVTYKVTDEDVDKVIRDLQQRNAMLYSVDREAKEGDFLYVDLQEVDGSGIPVIGQKIDNQQIWLNADDEELTPQLLGVKAGDKRNITLRVKTQQSELIEQPGQAEEVEKIYQVDVKEVKERRLPELDDEFAKDMGPYETLQELREKIENDLKLEAERESGHAFENALADALLQRVDLEVPESMLNSYLDNLILDLQERNKNNPQPFDPEQYRQVYRPGAIRDLKWHLISDRLKTQEKFVATDQDVEEKLARYAQVGDDGIKRAEEIRNNQKELSRLKDGIVFDKLYAFLADKAKITEVEKSWRELVEPEQATADQAA